jgi:hypothetical protein
MDWRYLLATILLIFSSTWVMADEIYRWTDENGKVHFGDRPRGTEAEAVGSTGAPSSTPDADTEATLDRQGRYLESLRREREQKEEQAAQAAEERRRRARNCKAARSRLETYRRASGVYRYNNKGEREYYDKEKRAAVIRQARKEVSYWCR